MSYVSRVLLPNETILYSAKVSPIIYLPGLLMCGLAIASAKYLPQLTTDYYYVALAIYKIQLWMPIFQNFSVTLSVLFFLVGIVLFINSYTIAYSTELAITGRRIVAKHGIATVTTTEIDRRKIAGVVINQTPLGQMFNYGKINIRGYTGDITGFPPIAQPYEFQKYVNASVTL